MNTDTARLYYPPNMEGPAVLIAYTRNAHSHTQAISLTQYKGDVRNNDALFTHVQRVIEIVRPGAVVTHMSGQKGWIAR